MRRFAIFFLSSTVVACSAGAPSPPVVTPPATPVTVTGTERIGWDQPAADAVELATFGYAIYVDGTRTVASSVTCGTTAATPGFPCAAALPPLTPGAHALQVASFVTDGALLESTRSAALQVTLVASTQTGPPSGADSVGAPSAARDAATSGRDRVGGHRASLVADGLVEPTDLAVLPDGRLLVAEKAGSVAIVDPAGPGTARTGQIDRASLHLNDTTGSSGALVALGIDPDFERTHFVFAIYTEPDRDNSAAFALARFREAAGTLADRAVLLDRIPAAAPPRAALRVGADGRLYAAFDAGGNADRAGDPASLNGKVLRLERDGTTPAASRSLSPIVATGVASPAGLVWPGGVHNTWLVDRGEHAAAQLRETGDGRRAYRLPDGFMPSSAAADPATGDLLIATGESGTLLRVRFDAASQPIGTDRVTLPGVDGIRALAIGSDAALYVATATRLWRAIR